MSRDIIAFEIDGAEAHVLEAALAIYRAELHAARSLGGPATDAAALMDPIARRVQAKLHDRLYGEGEAPEPDWTMPESADPVTMAKASEDGYHVHGYHDWQAMGEPDVEGMPEFNGAFRG